MPKAFDLKIVAAFNSLRLLHYKLWGIAWIYMVTFNSLRLLHVDESKRVIYAMNDFQFFTIASGVKISIIRAGG